MKITEIPPKPKENKIIRVAAYARVSADKDAAFHSLEAQTEYYQQYVASRQDWELAGVYSDNAISGTTINRPEFQRMLADCRAGKIDLVVTKSITRFARNTVILLQTIRELKALGIDCYFEKENMHAISPDGELFITLLALFAEEEARSSSENQLWRIRKKFENGEPWVGHMLGYRLVNGKMTIVPEEAEIVRQIYADYLSGMGIQSISKKLRDNHVTAKYSSAWSFYGIRMILSNEKYAGDMLLQKTYREDFRTKRKKRNHGKVRQYFVENSHPAIIDRATFEKVQREIQTREEKYSFLSDSPKRRHPFAGIIKCGICGHSYIRKNCKAHKNGVHIWICYSFECYGKHSCPSQRISEDILIDKTKEALQITEISREALQEKLARIEVPEHNHLRYVLKSGEYVDVLWENPSRSLSWTPEMKEAARQKTLARHRKER